MRPAAVYPTNPFFGCDRVRSMRRGGIYAARKTLRYRLFTVCMAYTSHCRGRMYAARRCWPHRPFMVCVTFILYGRAGVNARPTNRGKREVFPRTPLNGTPLPGGIYASPTNKGIAYTNPKTLPYGERPRAAYMRPLRTDRKRQMNGQGRCLPQSASGGRERPPYIPGYTVVFPVNPARGVPLPGGIYASPTNTRYRVHEPKNVPIRQTPTGRIHAAPTNRPKTADERARAVSTTERVRRA